jgi:hypothetical protein
VTRLVLDEQDAERVATHRGFRVSKNGKSPVPARDGPGRSSL